MPSERSHKDVQAHYAGLAAHYAHGSNKTCEHVYRDLTQRWFAGESRVLEIGCGVAPVVTDLPSAFRAGCDLSLAMLRAGQDVYVPCVAADGEALPFAAESFTAVVCVNVLEHSPDPPALISEVCRVLRPGGVFLAVTPNGRLEWLLEALERVRLKLPEGPHRFLSPSELRTIVQMRLNVESSGTFLACPVGGASMARALDRILPFGLFQYVYARRA